jgi:predicted N-acetyltransferase YhbS
VHAWIQDTMVATDARAQGISTELVAVAVREARAAGCEWPHVDFDDLAFYLDACGFTPTNAGLIGSRCGQRMRRSSVLVPVELSEATVGPSLGGFHRTEQIRA